MLSKQQMDSIAVMIGIEADVFAQAISNESETQLELPKGRFLTTENEATLLDNHGKKKYDEGKNKATKELFDGKDKDTYMSEYKDSILEEAKIEPNEKLKDVETRLETLQSKYETDIQTEKLQNQTLNEKLNSITRNSLLQNAMPELIETVSKNDAITLFNSTHEFKEDGIYKNGQLLVNDMQANLNQEQALASFISEKGWKKEALGGHGGKKPSFNGAKPKTYAEFEKYCEGKNIALGGEEANKLVKEFASTNDGFYD